MKSILKDKWVDMIIVGVLSTVISYGVSDWIPFLKGLALIVPIIGVVSILLDEKFNKNDKHQENEELVKILDETVKEQVEILDEYERIFNTQLVELPCVCGKNIFEGLFSPKTENVVVCEKCNNKYRITVSYDTVMIAEPMDVNQTFDELIGKSV